jgi:hypothetical protein
VVTLDDDDSQAGIGFEQRQRGPEPGVPGADDRHIDGLVTAE